TSGFFEVDLDVALRIHDRSQARRGVGDEVGGMGEAAEVELLEMHLGVVYRRPAALLHSQSSIDVGGADGAKRADGERAQHELADLDPLEGDDARTYGFDHAADLAVFSLAQGEFDRTPVQAAHRSRSGALAAPDIKALAEAGEGGVAEWRVHGGAVNLLDLGGRIGDALGEDAVVGEEQEAAGVLVEAADGEIPRRLLAHHIVDRGATAGIAVAGDDAGGLVQGPIEAARRAERAAVQLDLLTRGSDPGLRVAQHASGDRDPARGDPLGGNRAGSEAGAGKGPVQRHFGLVAARRLGRRRWGRPERSDHL